MSSPLDQALAELGNTIDGITGKVDENKKRVQEYKAKVILKLQEISQQIENLKNNNALNSIPDLKKRLATSQQELQTKTDELETTKSELSKANDTLKQLQDETARLNQDIAQKTDEIKKLTDSNAQKDGQLAQAKADLDDLTAQKNQLQQQLDQSNTQISSLVSRIATINGALVKQIGFIDSIAAELGDLDSNSDAVSNQFKAVSDNIMTVVNILNGSTPGPNPPPPPPPPQQGNVKIKTTPSQPSSQGVNILYGELIKSTPEKLNRFYDKLSSSGKSNIAQTIKANIDAAKAGDMNAEKIVKEQLAISGQGQAVRIMGGYKRRRTNKRRTHRRRTHRRRRKTYKGGYTYSPSLSKEHKEVDKKSTIVSDNVSHKIRSKQKTKKRF